MLDLYQLRTHDEFTSHLIKALPTITEGEFTSYNEYVSGGETILFKSDQLPYCPDPLHYAGVLQQYIQEHPVVTQWLIAHDESAHIISDFVPPSRFHKTTLHNEFYKPLKMSYLLFIGLKATNKRLLSISRHRNDREFHDSDKTVLDAIRPHLQQALTNALAVTTMRDQLAALNQAIETGQQAILSVTGEGRILTSTPTAQRLLNKYGVHTKRGTDWLPQALRTWLRKQIDQLVQADDIAPAVQPLTIAGKAGTLRIRHVRQDTHHLLLLQEDRPQVTDDLAHFGLTTRETEILRWVIQGKTNPEIGHILGISRRTVHKHLERIYARLGVENRHAAMTVTMEAIRRGRGGDN
ncbi:MAG: helix-turn-helix transcriptional regulator [Nitrospira sp.]